MGSMAPRYLALFLLLTLSPTHGSDWPMWRHDPGRTATTVQSLPEPLAPLWSRQLPTPAPAYRDARLRFDAAPEPIVLGPRLFIASNTDDSVTAFDTETGAELWRTYADGPVRFAPVAGEGRVIFGSDDGCVYCVKASDGSPVWKIRAVPSERRVLGNGRLISVWPVRGGPVLHEGRVYFAAGVWPLEGTFVFCVDAKTGETIWRNDRASYLYDIHPHDAESFGGLAPQGYLLVDGGDLIVPSSQAYPARFDLKTGELKEFKLPNAGRLPGGWFASTPSAQEEQKLKRRGLLFDDAVNASPHEDKMRTEGLPEIRATIRAGEREWKFNEALPGVQGTIHSLVAADGKLFVTTTDGWLHALGEKTGNSPETFQRPDKPTPTAVAPLPADLPRQGVAVQLGLGDASILAGLNAVPELHVIGIDFRSDRVGSLRQQGWIGNGPHFIETDPEKVELPPYLANLIVLDDSLPLDAGLLGRHYRALRPFGGKMIGRNPKWADLAKAAGLSRASIHTKDGWVTVTREGPLDGASNYTGDWAASEDQLVRAPLGLLWYGDSIQHFKRSPQPKFIDGVMISNPKDWTDSSTGCSTPSSPTSTRAACSRPRRPRSCARVFPRWTRSSSSRANTARRSRKTTGNPMRPERAIASIP
jgi:outer membrane protein assembly factor BamB